MTIISKTPFVDENSGKLLMPNLKPSSEGIVRFKEGNLSPGISFPSKLYVSPFNAMVPEKFRKIRVEGEFFDLKFNPFTGDANYLFSFGEGIRFDVRKFRDAIKLLALLRASGKKLFAELIFDGFPNVKFGVGGNEQTDFNLSKELNALESAVKLVSEFNVSGCIDVSLYEISKYEQEICQLESIIGALPSGFKVEFSIESGEYDPEKKTACISIISAPIGSHIFGIILVIIGFSQNIGNNNYILIADEVVIENKIVSEDNDPIKKDELVAAIELLESKYDTDYSVVTMFDKKC